MATTDIKQRRDPSDVHIRFDPGAKRDLISKQSSYIDGYRTGESATSAAKKKESGSSSGGQATNTIRSIINNLKSGGAEKREFCD